MHDIFLAVVKLLDEYDIPVHGLKDGIYTYTFGIGNTFFEYFDNPDLSGGKVELELNLQKSPQFIELDFRFNGSLRLMCDRCLGEFDFEITLNEKLFIRYGETHEELDDNILVITRDESRINIAQYIYEYLALSVPYKKVHPDKKEGVTGCDPEMIRRLNELKVDEESDTKTIKNTDPRWDKLRNLN